MRTDAMMMLLADGILATMQTNGAGIVILAGGTGRMGLKNED